jgi:hypothetical protein
VQLVPRDTQVVQAQLAQLGHKVFQEYLLDKAELVLLAHLDLLVLLGHKVYQVPLHNLVVQVLLVVQAQQDR